MGSDCSTCSKEKLEEEKHTEKIANKDKYDALRSNVVDNLDDNNNKDGPSETEALLITEYYYNESMPNQSENSEISFRKNGNLFIG